MTDIPLFGEIDFNSLVNSYWYTWYPSERHKKNDKRWWGTGEHLRELKKHNDKYMLALMWGK